jgi:hypothetical protein
MLFQDAIAHRGLNPHCVTPTKAVFIQGVPLHRLVFKRF